MSDEAFSRCVSEGLLRRGLTLRGLCRAAGLDPSFFSKVLSGKRSPPAEEAVLRRIARTLAVDETWLIVAAGRIPEEWGALRSDPELFRSISELAAGTRRPRRPAPRVVPARAAPAPNPGRGELAEELL